MYKEEDYYTLVKRPNGTWSYYCYTPEGKRVLRSTGRKKRADAVTEINRRIEEGRLVYPNGFVAKKEEKVVYANLAEICTDFYIRGKCPIIKRYEEKGRKYSLSRERASRATLVKNILPSFGHIRPEEVTPKMVGDWCTRMKSDEGVKAGTVNNRLVVLSEIFRYLIFAGLASSNPCGKAGNLARTDEKERTPFTQKQVDILFSDEEWRASPSYWVCLTAALTGLRLAEVLGLKVENVDKDCIHLAGSYSRTEGEKSTKAGWKREIPIPEWLNQGILQFVVVGCPYIFPGKSLKKPMSSTPVYDDLYERIHTRLGISEEERIEQNLTFHSFRHFFNTRLRVSGMGGELVRSVIGHEDEKMSEHYTHLTADDMDFVRQVQNGIMKKN